MDEKVETLEAKLQQMKEENRNLRLMLEAVSGQCEKLQSRIQEINNAEQVGIKLTQSGSALGRPEFFQEQNPLQIFVRTHPKDNSLTVIDGYRWKKYGQKFTKDNASPRAYFKCSLSPSCPVKKKVQRSIQDRSILVATYEGNHNHGVVLPDTPGPSSSTPKESIMANNIPMNFIPNYKDKMNTDLTLRGWGQTGRKSEGFEQQIDHFNYRKIEESGSCLIKDPDITIQVAEAVVDSINNQNKQLSLNLNLGLPEPQV